MKTLSVVIIPALLIAASPSTSGAAPRTLVVPHPAKAALIDGDKPTMLDPGDKIVVKRADGKALLLHFNVAMQGAGKPVAIDRPRGKVHNIDVLLGWAGGRIVISAGLAPDKLTDVLVATVSGSAPPPPPATLTPKRAPAPAPAPAPTPPQASKAKQPAAADQARACTNNDLHPGAKEQQKLDLAGCNTNDGKLAVICLSPSGRTLADPAPKEDWRELQDKQQVEVRLYARVRNAGDYKLAVRNERSVIWSPLKPREVKGRGKVPWARALTVKTRVYGSGWLRITIQHDAHTEVISTSEGCQVHKAKRELSQHVAGELYFSIGVMVSYVGLKDRSYSLATGDDGVSRIAEDQNDGVDVILNLIAYPLGVDEDKMIQFAPAFVVGTSLEKPMLRWYVGGQFELPLGFALTGGAVVAVVPKLSDNLIRGQPYTGDIPTSTTASFSWFTGINVNVVLFAKLFKKLVLPAAELPEVE